MLSLETVFNDSLFSNFPDCNAINSFFDTQSNSNLYDFLYKCDTMNFA